MNVLERAEGLPPSTYKVDPTILHLGIRLLDVPVSLETLRQARAVVLEHTRATAKELTRLFQSQVWGPYREREDDDPDQVESMRQLSAHMQPLVVQALVTAFQRSMHEELKATFADE